MKTTFESVCPQTRGLNAEQRDIGLLDLGRKNRHLLHLHRLQNRILECRDSIEFWESC